jgi:hypothetical protein
MIEDRHAFHVSPAHDEGDSSEVASGASLAMKAAGYVFLLTAGGAAYGWLVGGAEPEEMLGASLLTLLTASSVVRIFKRFSA